MKSKSVVGIQPKVLEWARDSLGLSRGDVALMLKRPVSEIESWETGEASPTYTQLEKLAYTVYKRPLAVFFLPEPPKEISPRREFRTLPEMEMQTLLPDTYLHIRKAHALQIILTELFDGKTPVNNPIWLALHLSQERSLAVQAQKIRQFLNISIEKQSAWSTDDNALENWRKTIEDAGIFVFKNSFKQKEISGFCIAHTNFPIIYLNNSTTKTRQIFSLLHELAHLLLNLNGLSKFDLSYIENLNEREKTTEIFCNAIAAEVLIPSDDFAQQISGQARDAENQDDEYFSKLANRYGVSREVILRRFLDRNYVSPAFYERKTRQWAAQKKQSDGGNWYASQNQYLSNRFAQEVIGRHYRHQLSIEQASDMLGIKAKNFARLEQHILQRVAA